MRKTRLYLPRSPEHGVLPPQSLETGMEIELPQQAAHHVSTVLRKKAGDVIYVFNGGEAAEYESDITFIKKSTVRVQLKEKHIVDNESPLQLTLYQGISRGDHMDTSIQKAVELGVQNIVPIICERSQIKLNANVLDKKMQHWQNIMISATQQSWRCYVPTLHAPTPFADALANKAIENHEEYTLLFDTEDAHPIESKTLTHAKSVGCWIGPEGGFTSEEVDAAKSSNADIVNLGKRILRTETATISALSIVQFLAGDLRQ